MYTLIILSADDDVARLEHSARIALVHRCEEEIIHAPAGEYDEWLSNLISATVHDQLKPVICYDRSDDAAEKAMLLFIEDVRRIARIAGLIPAPIRTYVC